MRFLFLTFLLVCSLCGAKTRPFEKVIIVVFENARYSDVVNLPFFKKLAAEGALLSNFHAITHPSQPNYIALVSGSLNGCFTNDVFNSDAKNIGDLLSEKGVSWKVYAESYPGNCSKEEVFNTYARKHNPFISFRSIQNDSEKCAHIVNANELQIDVENNTVPQYSFYVPDMNNSGHDTSAAYADKWYQARFGPLLQNPHFMNGMLLVSTFDESDYFEPTNHIYTSFYGNGVKRGAVSPTHYTLYSLLRTIEDAFGLGTMADMDKQATPIDGIWNP